MILVDDGTLHAYEWLVTSNCHFNATFRPSRASSGIYMYVCMRERGDWREEEGCRKVMEEEKRE